jgi:hypothetical protein
VPRFDSVLRPGIELVLSFPDADLHLVVNAAGQVSAQDARGRRGRPPEGVRAGAGRTVELAIPLRCLEPAGGVTLALALRDSSGADFRSWSARLTPPGVARPGQWRA